MKVSFDADGTLLGSEKIREYAKELINRGHEVWIVTRRYSDINSYTKDFCERYGIANLIHDHRYLFDVAKQCGIKPENIHFMNMVDKYWFFKNNTGFLWHLDDDSLECNDINKYTDTKAICCSSSSWFNKCEKLLNNERSRKSK